MDTLPLTKAEQFYPFFAFMGASGFPTQSYLERHSLPPRMLEDPDVYIDETRFWRLMQDLGNREALHDFGFRVGSSMELSHFGEIGPYLMSQPTLYVALQLFCDIATVESQVCQFGLIERGDSLWFVSRTREDLNFFSPMMELYELQLMHAVIAAALGQNWLPKRAWLRASGLPNGLHEERLSSGGIDYNSTYSGLVIPKDMLPSRMIGYDLGLERKTPTEAGVPVELGAQLRWLIRGYIDEDFCLEELAELTHMSNRTLQRRLTECGTSFRRLQEGARFDAAMAMLDANQRTITDISYELGYSSPANFSRAFHRWAGVSPKQYLKARRTSSSAH